MSKKLDKEDVIKNKKEAIKKLNALLEKYINDPSGDHLKKANLMSYWLKDYVRYINFEESFQPKRNISYKRGDIIKVGFGFNVGSEYGGLHYAIVLDNKNDHSSSTVTVIPLTSIKDEYSDQRHNVDLGNEIYRLLKLKCDTVKKAISDERERMLEDAEYFGVAFKMARYVADQVEEMATPDFISTITEDNADQIEFELEEKTQTAHKLLEFSEAKVKEIKERTEHISVVQKELEKISNEIDNMKEGSIALVGQITTISKMRIYDPKKSKDVLYGIRLSAENMDKINSKIKELYVFEEK